MSRPSRLTRRGFIAATGAAGAGVLLAPDGRAFVDSMVPHPTNVILLIVDTLRPDHVGAYGSSVQTPNLDAIARRGLRFTRAHPEAMATVPARRSIFESKRIFPFRGYQAVGSFDFSPGWAPIDDPTKTFIAELRRNGWFTTHVTDNPHTGFRDDFQPLREVFNRHFSVTGYGGEVNPPSSVPQSLLHKWLPKTMRGGGDEAKVRSYIANVGIEREDHRTIPARLFGHASNLLDEAAARKPFAMVVDCFSPHEPWYPPQEYMDMYGEEGYDGQEVGTLFYRFSGYLTDAELRRARTTYAASVTAMDRWLGTFLDKVSDLGLWDNTVVAVVADHGLVLGERGWTGKIPSQLHPELAQVPFMIADPRGRLAGRKSDHFVSTHDIGPTLLSMVGLKPPRWVEGADLSPLFEGRRAQSRDFQYGGYYNRIYVRTDEWLLIGDTIGGRFELFDLERDPAEVNDVYADNKQVAERLFAELVERVGGPMPFLINPDQVADPPYPEPA